MALAAGAICLASGACSKAKDASAEVRRLRAENAALRQHVPGDNSYQCAVSDYMELGGDGGLQKGVSMRDQVMGASFVVDKANGTIVGGIGGNSTSESHRVVFTPPGNLFHVVSESHGPNKSVGFLSIRDWAEGVEKPFVMVESQMVVSGICR